MLCQSPLEQINKKECLDKHKADKSDVRTSSILKFKMLPRQEEEQITKELKKELKNITMTLQSNAKTTPKND